MNDGDVIDNEEHEDNENNDEPSRDSYAHNVLLKELSEEFYDSNDNENAADNGYAGEKDQRGDGYDFVEGRMSLPPRIDVRSLSWFGGVGHVPVPEQKGRRD